MRLITLFFIIFFNSNIFAQNLSQAITLGAEYMQNHLHQDGKFDYQVFLDKNKKSFGYNIIRHSGAIYSLGLYNNFHRNKKTENSIKIATNYLIDFNKNNSRINLGNLGLGLVALTSAYKIERDNNISKEMYNYANNILKLQNEDGSFDTVSLYYPGEATLGLIMLYNFDHNSKWLFAAEKSINYLLKKYEITKYVPIDHWLLIAIRQFFPNYNNLKNPLMTQEKILKISNKIAEVVLSEPRYTNFRVAPLSTRMEGLASLHAILPDSYGIKLSIKNYLRWGADQIMVRQITNCAGEYSFVCGGFINVPENSDEYILNQQSIRIDYPQHAISALLVYDRTK